MSREKAECVLCLTDEARVELLEYLELWYDRTVWVLERHNLIVNKRGRVLDYYLPKFTPADTVHGAPAAQHDPL